MKSVKKICFIRTDRMGDLLMNLPAIRVLHQTYPEAVLQVVTDQKVACLLEGHTDIHEVWGLDAGRLEKQWSYRWDLIKRIRKERPDMVVVSNPKKLFHLAAFLSGAPYRVGYSRKWGFLLTHKIADDEKVKSGRHEIENNLALVDPMTDRGWDGHIYLEKKAHAVSSVEAKFALEGVERTQAVIALHPGTSRADKRWAPANFSEIVRRITDELKARVVLIGGAEEAGVSEEVASGSSRRPINWTGKLTLDELVAFLGDPRIRLLVSCDSGPVHIAWMQGTPVVALYAANVPGSSSKRWGPRDGQSQTVDAVISSISADSVFESILKVMEKKR